MGADMEEPFDTLQKLELAQYRAEHQKRFQVMINFIKQEVGEGIEYRNDIVRAVVSETGAYYELLDLPEEFCGAVSDQIERRFIAPEEATTLLKKAVDAIPTLKPETTRQFSVITLYTRRGLVDRKNCFIYDFLPESPLPAPKPVEIGKFQPGVMPLFFKIKTNSEAAAKRIGIPRGVTFCMSNAGDRNLLIHIPYEGDQITDLGSLPMSKTVN